MSGWVGWLWFCGAALVTTGVFNAMDGLLVLFVPERYLAIPSGEQLVLVDTTAWGWWHVLYGAALVGVGLALLAGAV